MNDHRNNTRPRYKPITYLRVLIELFQPQSFLHFLARNLRGGATLRPVLHRLRGVDIRGSVWIGDDVYIDDDYPRTVEIHDEVVIATRCTIIGHTHGLGRVIIDRKAAIGTGCTIVCAAGQTLTIGEGAVVAAGSVITSSIPPHTIYGPPRAQVYGIATVPFTMHTPLDKFRRGVRPIKLNVQSRSQESNPQGPVQSSNDFAPLSR